MTKEIVSLCFIFVAASNGPAALGAPGGPAAMIPSPVRLVRWSSGVAGPRRIDLDQALDRALAYPWSMFDRKSGQRREARTCRQLLALDPTSDPMDVHDDNSPPTRLSSNDWNVYYEHFVSCRITVAIQDAKPSRVSYLGTFALDDRRLKEIPAAVIPTPSQWEEKRLKEASARGTSWKGWDRLIRVTKTFGAAVTVESPDTRCHLSVDGRGDFDDDGIEDLVLSRSGGGQEGTWSSTAAFVLTRRSPHGRIEIVKVIE
jgi:hypothetical protein